MRTAGGHRGLARVLELDPADFRALAALETLFTQEARWEECIEVLERKAEALAEPDGAGRRADAGGPSGRTRSATATGRARSTSASCSSTANHDGVDGARAPLPPAQQLGEAGRAAAGAHRVRRRTRRSGSSCSQVAEIYEQQLGDRESAFVMLQAAFREDYSNDHVAELERLATATNKWTELISDYTQVVQAIADPKLAADLWVKIGRWYGEDLGHLEYAIASEQQALALDAEHVGALPALADFYRKKTRMARAGGGAGPPRRGRGRAGEAGRDPAGAGRAYERQLGDAAQAMGPTSRRWRPTSAAWRPSTRSSGSTAARRPGTA